MLHIEGFLCFTLLYIYSIYISFSFSSLSGHLLSRISILRLSFSGPFSLISLLCSFPVLHLLHFISFHLITAVKIKLLWGRAKLWNECQFGEVCITQWISEFSLIWLCDLNPCSHDTFSIGNIIAVLSVLSFSTSLSFSAWLSRCSTVSQTAERKMKHASHWKPWLASALQTLPKLPLHWHCMTSQLFNFLCSLLSQWPKFEPWHNIHCASRESSDNFRYQGSHTLRVFM